VAVVGGGRFSCVGGGCTMFVYVLRVKVYRGCWFLLLIDMGAVTDWPMIVLID